MEKNNSFIKTIGGKIFAVIAIAAAIFCLAALYVITGVNAGVNNDKNIILDDGWSVIYNGESYNDVNLNNFRLPKTMGKGDKVVLYTSIPKNFKYDTPVIKIPTTSSVLKVSVNGKLVYTYGEDRYEENKLVGSGWHYIPVKKTDAGKNIRIIITSTEDATFSSIDAPVLMEYSDVFQQMMIKNRVPYVSAVSLILFGALIMALAGIMMIKRTGMSRLFWIGALSVTVGTWTACNYRLTQLFNIPLPVTTTLEYINLVLGALSVAMYFKDNVYELKDTFMINLYKIFVGGLSVFIVVSFTLQFTNLYHLPSLLEVIHVFIVLEVIYMMVLMIRVLKSGTSSGKVLFIGFCLVSAFIFVDVVRYMVKTYIGVQIFSDFSMSAAGVLIFVVVMIMNFSIDVIHNMNEAKEQEVLYRMAYMDDLTKISNRRYCEKVMEELSSNNENFGIFSFDLNNLKKINDNMGHTYGDDLISGFAHILKETFEKEAVVGRMGGDEFIVIIRSDDGRIDHETFRKKLQHVIDEYNHKESRFKYSVACGYADSTEAGVSNGNVDARQIYSMADDRMYVHKRKIKEKMKQEKSHNE